MVAAPREEIRAHVAPAVSPRTIGNCLFAAGLRSRVPLARQPLTPPHRQAQLPWCHERVDCRVEWRSVVPSDESRLCLYVSDGRIRVRRGPGERHLSERIRPWHIGSNSAFMVWGAISSNSRFHFMFLHGKVNGTRYISYVVNPVLLSVLRQEGDVVFQQNNACPHIASAMRRALRGVQ